MLSALLITLREGLEAALIVGIILAYLVKIRRPDLVRYAWLGMGGAAVVSLVAGVAVYATAGELAGRAEQVFEGAATLLAAVVLTWMIFWMHRQASGVRASLQSQVDATVAGGSWLGLAALSFVAVAREGIETVLFLFAASRTAESPLTATVGGLLGLAIAAGIGYLLYRGTARLNLKTFFNVTSAVMIVFAAGLLGHAVHEFNEAGIVPAVIEHVWDTGRVLSDSSVAGRFLASILGYSSSPSLTEVMAYVVYMSVALLSYFRRRPKTGALKA
jgi:high-affinity iron transporter